MNPQKQTEALCRKLKPIIGDQADMLWHMYLSEDDLGRRKVSQDIEVIAERYLKEQPLEDRQILLDQKRIQKASIFWVTYSIIKRNSISSV